jgi:hypothetical protein
VDLTRFLDYAGAPGSQTLPQNLPRLATSSKEMPKSFDQSDYERWAKAGQLDLLRDYDSAALSWAGDKLVELWDRWASVTDLKSNFVPTTSVRVQASYRPGEADFRQLSAIECKAAYDRCLSTLSDGSGRLVERMLVQGISADQIAGERYREMNSRAASTIVRSRLCEALGDIYPAVKKEANRLKESVAKPSQSEARRKDVAFGR